MSRPWLPIDRWKDSNRGIALITAYDALFARLSEEGGADAVLVGDSLGPAILGIPESEVTLSDMIHHGSAVRRGLHDTPLILDIPARTCECRPSAAVAAMVRAATAVDAAAVKIEGANRRQLVLVQAALSAGLCVMGHISPADGDEAALSRAAESLAQLGTPAIMLQNISPHIATRITKSVAAATISVHSGSGCDGSLANALDLAGLRQSPHDSDDSHSHAGAAVVISRITEFCAQVGRARFSLGMTRSST